MQNNQELISQKLREVRGNRSYASMAKAYSGECGIDSVCLWKYEHGRLHPPIEFLTALAEQEGLSLDKFFLERNMPLVAQFNEQHEAVARSNGELLVAFEDDCWALADAERGKVCGSNLFQDNCDESDNISPMYAKRFGEVRTYTGKSVDEVAALMGCHRSSVYRNENVRRKPIPTVHYLFDFCSCMKASADYIAFGEFRGLRKHTSTILAGLPYQSQLALLAEFIQLSKKFLP